jgi:hypothetical protein
MGHDIYYQAFYSVIGFSSCVHQATLNLDCINWARVAIRSSYCLDGGDLPSSFQCIGSCGFLQGLLMLLILIGY